MRLRELGAEVIELPMIEIAPPLSWHDVDQAIENIDAYDWMFFASSNSAKSFIDRAAESSAVDFLRSGRPHRAAIGKSTARYMQDRGAKVDYVPPEFVAESFVESFPGYPNLRGLKILWPRTNIGRDYIFEKLTAAGAEISIVEAYRTVLPEDAEVVAAKLSELLHLRKVEVITFTSGQTARNFAQVLERGAKQGSFSYESGEAEQASIASSPFAKLLEDVTLVSIGPETTKAISDCGLPACLEAESHDAEGLVQAILSQFRSAFADQT
jgi:uroporphyrinogen-III synthase